MPAPRKQPMDDQPNLPANRLARFIAAAPDMATSTLYVWTWIDPLHFGNDMVKSLMLVMLMEFLVVHSGAFIGLTVLSDSATRGQKTVAIVGFGAFYMLFAGAFSLAFHSWWPALSFLWLLGARFAMVWLTPLPKADEVQRQTTLWGLSVMAYLASVFAGVLLPIPQWGITEDVLPTLALPGSGLWIEQPQTVIVGGALYFALVAWSKYAYRGSWAKNAKPTASR
jgi:hypothetical protein